MLQLDARGSSGTYHVDGDGQGYPTGRDVKISLQTAQNGEVDAHRRRAQEGHSGENDNRLDFLGPGQDGWRWRSPWSALVFCFACLD